MVNKSARADAIFFLYKAWFIPPSTTYGAQAEPRGTSKRFLCYLFYTK
jgi:hypothetical protein